MKLLPPKRCELCHTTNEKSEALCPPCGEAITRLMTIRAYLSNHAADCRNNREQARLLLAFSKGAN